MVSVVVPTRDRLPELKRCVEAVLAQTFHDWELVVVDDGSVDGSATWIRALGDPRIRVIEQEPSGASAARNRGAEAATSRVLLFLDSDDEPLPDWLVAITSAWTDQDSVGLVSCGVFEVRGDAIEERLPSATNPASTEPVLMLAGAFAVERQVFHAVGGYRPELDSGQHTDLSFRLLPYLEDQGRRFVAIDRPLVRIHRTGRKRIRDSAAAVHSGTHQLLELHAGLLRTAPRVRADYLAVAGVAAARLGLMDEARDDFRAALRSWPLGLRGWLRYAAAWWPPLAERLWGSVR